MNQFEDKIDVTFTTVEGERSATLKEITGGNAGTWLTNAFKKATVTFTHEGIEHTAELGDIIAGNKVALLPPDFARKATVTFTHDGIEHTAELGDIIAGNKVALLPPDFARKATVTFTHDGREQTISLADIIAGNDVALLPKSVINTAQVRYRSHPDHLLELEDISDIDAGLVVYNTAVRSTADERADLEAAVGARTIGLITVPDGTVFQTYDPATDSWTTITADAAPDRDGQQVEIDLAGFVTQEARFVTVDGNGDPVSVQPSAPFVTVKVRVFDGTDLSSVERDIRIHVEAVNDAPTATDAPSTLIPQFVQTGEDGFVTLANTADNRFVRYIDHDSNPATDDYLQTLVPGYIYDLFAEQDFQVMNPRTGAFQDLSGPVAEFGRTSLTQLSRLVEKVHTPGTRLEEDLFIRVKPDVTTVTLDNLGTWFAHAREQDGTVIAGDLKTWLEDAANAGKWIVVDVLDDAVVEHNTGYFAGNWPYTKGTADEYNPATQYAVSAAQKGWRLLRDDLVDSLLTARTLTLSDLQDADTDPARTGRISARCPGPIGELER